MEKSEKVLLRILIVLFGGCALLLLGWYAVQEYMHPNVDRVLSRMERRDPEKAQEIMDAYGEELIKLIETTEFMGPDEEYRHSSYYIYSGSEGYKTWEMPQELADALKDMKNTFPEYIDIRLHRGQIAVRVSSNGDGFSLLCYPGGEYFAYGVMDNEEGARCLDMGGGWELQMYYAPGS